MQSEGIFTLVKLKGKSRAYLLIKISVVKKRKKFADIHLLYFIENHKLLILQISQIYDCYRLLQSLSL